MTFDELPIGNLFSLYYDQSENSGNENKWRLLKTGNKSYRVIQFFDVRWKDLNDDPPTTWNHDIFVPSCYTIVDEGIYVNDL